MQKDRKNTAAILLSVLILMFTVIATAGGLLARPIYQDTDFIKVSWKANDMVTLFIAVPLMIIAIVNRHSQRWYLVWMGLLAYMIYNYAFYLFGASFNKFFVLYVSIFTMSIYALISGIQAIDLNKLPVQFSQRTPVKLVAIYLFMVTLPLLIIELSQCISFIYSEKQPAAPPLIFALDLSLVIPASLVAAVLLWKREGWGYLLATIVLVKGFVYGLVLSMGTGLLAYSSVFGKWDILMPFYILVTIGGLLGCWILLKNLKGTP